MSQLRLFSSPVLRTRNFLAAAALGLLLTPALVAANPCVQPDAGGTVVLPPTGPGCPYVSPTDFHMIINGLPAGTTIQVGVEHSRFVNITNTPGGPLGGEVEQFNSDLVLQLKGTGALAGYNRTVMIPGANCVAHTGPRTPGTSPQSFDTDMFGIMGQLPNPIGDPDFDLLRIRAGSGFGMPSPGHTTLTQLPGGNWNVDSFFDVFYEIEFIGKPGGPLSGMSGSTTGTIRMGSGEPPVPPCTVVDDGSGTVSLPPAGCGYVSPDDLHKMIDGLPVGTTINVAAEHAGFFNINHFPDPAGSGEIEQFSSGLQLKLDGTGELHDFHRMLTIQTQCQAHSGPRQLGTTMQSFDTEMMGIQGQLPPGDPDFDLLRITAGTGLGLPSPGHTTLTRNPTLTGPGTWNVHSFFDITYRIDFVGAPGGPLAGRSGSTTATIRMQTGRPPTTDVPELQPQGPKRLKLSNRPNPFSTGTSFEYRLSNPAKVRLAVYDAAGKLVRRLTDEVMPAGPHAMYWDARNDAGRKVGVGTYFVKISVNDKLAGSTKATIVR